VCEIEKVMFLIRRSCEIDHKTSAHIDCVCDLFSQHNIGFIMEYRAHRPLFVPCERKEVGLNALGTSAFLDHPL
jgi:hypothetical protein